MSLRAPTAELPGGTAEPGPALLSPAWRATLWVLVVAVLCAGLFLPDLMDGDAAQDAVMAFRMFREGDWSHLVNDGLEYLDKPHLLFWSAMAGYRLFGVHDWSYRLASVLVSLLGAFSSARLARRLYGARAGQMAALFFITAQATLLGNHDVRMDALLTGFTAFGVWQLARWADTEDLRSLALGGLGVGLAVASKGMVAAALAGLCLVLYLWGRGRLRLVASPRILIGVAAFAAAIAPVLVAYYLQYDLHPEKVVRGQTGVSGVRFILLGQSADRFTGGRGNAASGDYLFFFHTLLWAFLPWPALLATAWGNRFRELWRGGRRAFHSVEQLAFLGPLVYVVVLNFSRFKLPHYLNVAFPLLAVLTAGTLDGLAAAKRSGALRVLTRVQDVVVVLLLAGTVFLNGWAFPVRSAWVVAGAAAFLVVLVLAFRLRDALQRLWVPSAVAILLLNFALEASVYPQLSRLQPGAEFARKVATLPIDWDRFTFMGWEIYHPFQLYTGHLIPAVDPEVLARRMTDGKPAFTLATEGWIPRLERNGLHVRELARWPACQITMVRWPMLNPRTRDQACPPALLLRIERQGPR